MKLLPALILSMPLWAQSQPAEGGIAVRDPLVLRTCSPCHHQDAKGNLTRISWVRTTPEGWEMAVKRMVRLNGLDLNPQEARAIVKSLAASHGLAPEEAKPVLYISERKSIEESFPNENVREACAACHPIGQAKSWRRSKEEWNLLVAMHRGYYPIAEDSFHHIDDAIDYFAKNYPLESPEWAAWRAKINAPNLTGRWLISGYQAGRGGVVGEMLIEPDSEDDAFTTNVKLTYVKDGTTISRTGKAVVFAGYSWRGRSSAKSGAAGPSPSNAGGIPQELRETMWLAPDQSEMQGRWFWGDYEEFGYEVTLKRASGEVTLLGLDRSMIKTGSSAQQVRIFADHLPRLAPADVDFGSGVTVRRILEQTTQQATVELDVDAAAAAGKRDVMVRGARLAEAVSVYSQIDYIKVVPDSALARLGGQKYPKGYQQFEAFAYQRGAPDIGLGPVDAEWSMEEFYSAFGDDDKNFVGTLSPSGFFRPSVEGPNPKRQFSRNNYGDVWVVATYKRAGGSPLVAKSYLVVTVPLYVRYDRQEAAP
jgi:quinohemoprotein amine dehydrogenase